VGNIVGTTNQDVEVATLATATVTSTTLLPTDTVPTDIALVSSASGDQLAVVDQKGRLFLVAMTSPPTLVGTAPLSNPAISVVASPDGLWAYVLEGDASGNNFVEAIDLGSLRQGLPLATTTPLPVGASSQQLVLSQSGDTLYVPYTGGASALAGGGVAIVTVSEKACCDLFWKSLDGCPSCASADCIVLATIYEYKVGFWIQDQTDPPADPAKDLPQQFARIDNYTRHLLPSTSTIAEVVKCLCESKGGSGTNGAPSKDGAPGLGLNPDLPKILDIGWVHKDTKLTWDDFLRAEGGYNLGAVTSEVVQKHIKAQDPPLIMIYFNQPVLTGIDRQTLLVSIEYPVFEAATATAAIPIFTGLYATLNIYGYPVAIPGPLTTPHTLETTAQSAWAFIPDQNLFQVFLRPQIVNAMFTGVEQKPPFDPPCVHITLKGDFIYAGATFADKMMLDADNIGGQVGLNVTRGVPPTGGKNPSGDLVEGGDFESWFFLQPPVNAGNRDNLINPNSASANDLANLPGVSSTIAKKIVAERDVNGPFTSLDDLGTRLKLSDKIVNSLRDHVTFD